MNDLQVLKPEKRGTIRKNIGKEYFIIKRKLRWLMNHHKYANTIKETECPYTVISHKSLLLRPLKDVEMYLQHNKVTNLTLAIRNLDGIVIQPGQTFSIWKKVGRPTKRKGYLEGLVLHNGEISKGIGGGLCQLGNLLYWMVLHTDLEVTERWRHSFDVFPDVNRTIPFACGATLAYNYVDLEFVNNTDMIFSVHLWVDEKYLNGQIKCNKKLDYKFEVEESDHRIVQQWWGGYTRHNKIWKSKTDLEGKVLNKELVTDNHAVMMYNPLLESK